MTGASRLRLSPFVSGGDWPGDFKFPARSFQMIFIATSMCSTIADRWFLLFGIHFVAMAFSVKSLQSFQVVCLREHIHDALK